jgi:hypothetical protein
VNAAGRLVRLALVLAVAAMMLAACDSGGDASEPGSTDSDGVSVFDLEPGMCIDGVREAEGRVDELAVVACDMAHDGEVISVFDLEGDAEAEFPGSNEVDDQAAVECEARFEDYVGLAFQESRFQATYIAPSEETWSAGDREVVCFAYVARGELRRSIEGSAE